MTVIEALYMIRDLRARAPEHLQPHLALRVTHDEFNDLLHDAEQLRYISSAITRRRPYNLILDGMLIVAEDPP